jgi:hypothetical protein
MQEPGALGFLKQMANDLHPQVRDEARSELMARAVPDDADRTIEAQAQVQAETRTEVESIARPSKPVAAMPQETEEETKLLDETLQRTMMQLAKDLAEEERRVRVQRALYLAGAKGYMRMRGGEIKDTKAVECFYEVTKIQLFLKESLARLGPDAPRDRHQKTMAEYQEHLKLALVRLGKALYIMAKAGKIPITPELEEVGKLA